MEKPEISINEVLARMEADAKPFLLKFVRATGSKRGSIKTVGKCIKGAPRRALKKRTRGGRGLHKVNYTVPVTDLEMEEYLTPLISHITQFNQFKVIH